MKRNLMFVSWILLLGLVAAPASAQLVTFQTNSVPVFVPTGGTASAVGVVALTATSPGTMAATGYLRLTYGAPLASGATAVVTCAAATDCTYGINFTVAASGSTVTVTFVTNVTFNLGNSVRISGVHLNVSGIPSGSNISASASGTAFFLMPNTVVVASVTNTPPASPAVSLSPTSLTFSNQALGTTSSAQSVTLTNSGNAALTITSIATIGDFGQTNACGSSLDAGAHCSINVTFTPTAAGTRLGMLTITTNAGGSPDGVTLSGTGVTLKRRGQLVSE